MTKGNTNINHCGVSRFCCGLDRLSSGSGTNHLVVNATYRMIYELRTGHTGTKMTTDQVNS